MHFNFNFSAAEILWTLSFAALLVLLVVLLGRDRMRRYPWFTASILLITFRMVANRLLFNKLAPLTSSEVFLALADVIFLVSLLVVVEMARRAFARASRIAWIVGALAVAGIGVAVLALWGPWPSLKTALAGSTLAHLRLMQLVAQKGDLLVDVLTVQLCMLVAFAGRRFNAGWRSHTQQIILGLSTMSVAQLIVRALWQAIERSAAPHSQAEYQRIGDLQDKIINANTVVFFAVTLWWIVWLWLDEPGSKSAEALPANDLPADELPMEPAPEMAPGGEPDQRADL